MNSSAPVNAMSEQTSPRNAAAKGETRALEPCPGCGGTTAQEWLRAPDRLHGRREAYSLLRCPACSLVWLTDPPKPEEMYLHYTQAYNRLIASSGKTAPRRWRDRNATLTQYKKSGCLLDLGCSSGSFLEFIRGDAWKLFGVEMSPEEAKAAEAKSGAQVFVGSVVDAPFLPGTFDVITCFDVFEHLYQPRQIMAKIAEWLKPGGIFYVLVPNIDSAEARVFRSYWHGLEMPRHLFHYTPASLKFLAESAGLKPLSLETRRNPAVGTSMRYVWEDVFRACGIHPTPVAYRGEAGFAWRAARKAVRMTVLRALLAMAPLVGGGESIHAVFQKERV